MSDQQLKPNATNDTHEASASTSVEPVNRRDDLPSGQVQTPLGAMTLSMFQKGQYVRVRVGSAHNATELYEHAYSSADEANTALLDAGILTSAQVPDPAKLAGTGLELTDITAEQLEEAGLKRHLSSNL